MALLWRHAWPSVDDLDDGGIIARPEADVDPRVGNPRKDARRSFTR
jgi:hypothetical protein